ncbi:site-2 protease family protein [Mastigocoleus sp. MO_188.B34]|uniref:site-2 protease family protein n=1 Tax=Mastigocoleus sp. MO_188.B34 TaxID=3036635 RepID=UPI0026140D7C|nr:site-2 protease family protein [Mastigocoleus sp. MO_188.B34]MDJ0696503.1 site-2 protease family protein [Mastigocoleus sp. MO_188.B34]
MFILLLITQPLLFFRYIIIIIASIVLHELAHGFSAISQGDNTPEHSGHMTLNPIVHMGWYSIIFLCLAGFAWGQMPVNPRRFRHGKLSDIIVSAAGPLSNLALGCIFLTVLAFFHSFGVISSQFFYLGAKINFLLFLFNMLPIPPLDGFHVLSQIFPGLKPLDNPQTGMVLFMIIFLVPGFSEGLQAVADLIISLLSGIKPDSYMIF